MNTSDAYGIIKTGQNVGDRYNRSAKTIGAYHMIGDDSFEPQRTNNFELIVTLDTENTNGQDLSSVQGNIHYTNDYAEACLRLSVQSAGQIVTDVGIIEIPYGNTKVKFAGVPNISTTDIVFNDYLGKDTERILAAWHGQVFNPNNQKIGKASKYKKTALLIETAPDGSNGRAWRLYGIWPSNMQYGSYDYNTSDVRKIQATFSYDIAVPLDD